MSAHAPSTVDVLIVGAGPVGLALAVELGTRGIRTLVVEQHERVGRQPRAKTTNVRTMEHMRRWGLAGKVRAASPLPAGYPNDVVFATRMFGHSIVRIENAFYARHDRDERYSEGAQWIPQYAIEEILREKAQSLPACSLRFRAKYLGSSMTDAGVEATIQDLATDQTEAVSAAYLVGADGARSAVRDELGFAMEGEHSFGAFCNLVLRIPGLGAAHPRAPALMYWLANPVSPSVMGPMDHGDTWFWGIQLKDDRLPDDGELRRLVAEAIGKDLEFEILTKDPWFAHRLVANAYRSGRVFLAGDACHLHPPFGGFGMNLGVGDAVDLGWKLAAAIEGWGGPDLLDSYEAERRPVHRRVIDVAVENTAVLMQHFIRPELEDATPDGDAARQTVADMVLEHKVQEFHSLGVVLGSHYSGSPIVVADGSSAPAPSVIDYTASAHPGCRAPHCWLADGSSLFDELGAGFTLLATTAYGEDEVAPLLAAAEAAGVPIELLAPEHGRLRELYAARFALIRPDQHVAWRGDTVGPEPAWIIDTVRGAVHPRIVAVDNNRAALA